MRKLCPYSQSVAPTLYIGSLVAYRLARTRPGEVRRKDSLQVLPYAQP